MKIRNGFVSNSSTSSFIFMGISFYANFYEQSNEKLQTLIPFIQEYQDELEKILDAQEYDIESIVCDLYHMIFDKEFGSKFDMKYLELIDNFYFNYGIEEFLKPIQIMFKNECNDIDINFNSEDAMLYIGEKIYEFRGSIESFESLFNQDTKDFLRNSPMIQFFKIEPEVVVSYEHT